MSVRIPADATATGAEMVRPGVAVAEIARAMRAASARLGLHGLGFGRLVSKIGHIPYVQFVGTGTVATAVLFSAVFSGMFDKLPKIKFITHHLGAMVPFLSHRVGYGMDQFGSRTTDEDYEGQLKKMKQKGMRPVDYFRMFYADTALFGALAPTKCGLEFFGIDRVLFASDVPFEPAPGLFIRETIRVIESLGLAADDKDRIYRRNAERLLNLVPSPTS